MSGSRTYKRLAVEDFGRQLITSGDLDPIYIALHNTVMGKRKKARWLVAYWCLYHAGVASYLSDFSGVFFWEELRLAAENKEGTSPVGSRWPRGVERRHWRGKAAIASWAYMSKHYPHPEDMVERIAAAAPKGYPAIANAAISHVGFGPWIAFKIADMLDRCYNTRVSFDEAAVFMFKDPVKSALMVYRDKAGLPDNAKIKDEKAAINDVVRYLTKEFSDLLAPPQNDRPIGLQEVETVLCCWKSHMNGHYPLYNDIREIREGLAPWAEVCQTAGDFLEAMPPLPKGEV